MTKDTKPGDNELLHLLDDLAMAVIDLYAQAEGKELPVNSRYGKLVEAADDAIRSYRAS